MSAGRVAGQRNPPRIDVVGLGPAGPELITAGALASMDAAPALFLRTRRHPSAAGFPGARTFDHHYERGETFEEVYRAIVSDLVEAATRYQTIVYAVPGSPLVGERTVTLLREHPAVAGGELTLTVHPSVSFVDLALARLGIDPLTSGVRIIDAESFAIDAAGERGPLLVAQCWSRGVLSDIKLAAEIPSGETVTVLHHLGLDDEVVRELEWDDLDRTFTPDHLTSLWIPRVAAPVAAELVRLDELVHLLRQRCPWDRQQTHGSLARHLLEESYEVLEAIDALAALDAEADAPVDGRHGLAALGPPGTGAEERAVADLEEELGDLLFQVYFHATLAAEAGRFTLADVARGVHDKLVSRHPHVFGAVTAETGEDVAANWEALKKSEKNRSSVTEGIPAALPALALAAKLQRKALAVGMVLPGVAEEAVRVAEGVSSLGSSDAEAVRAEGQPHVRVSDGAGGRADHSAELGELLFSLANVARALGIDPETALRSRAATFRTAVEKSG
ncbi:MAG TPA: MazG nucleotide pyrophosphohydrolase domain-containing protein [Acidimicrobiales bacterium]|jgi:tetrapyrrole methylase family protein/MazG family protein|nr:MazG nucleotide pyrophosphohydrolase domain-containing protein [Acidimicrobiales bacterium]